MRVVLNVWEGGKGGRDLGHVGRLERNHKAVGHALQCRRRQRPPALKHERAPLVYSALALHVGSCERPAGHLLVAVHSELDGSVQQLAQHPAAAQANRLCAPFPLRQSERARQGGQGGQGGRV